MTSFLLNALWQLPLLTAAGLLAGRLLRPFGPLAIHRLWLTVAALELLIPAASFVPAGWLGMLLAALETSGKESGNITVLTGPATAIGAIHLPATLRAVVLFGYPALTAVLALRLLWRAVRLRTLRRSATPVPLTPELDVLWRGYESRFHTRAVLVEAAGIPGPITIGLRRKLLILPESMLETLPAEDLDALLAHEFAHMRRHDFAINLALQILSLPIAFHPAFWLTRSRLVESRELVCDRIAAAHAGTVPYTRSLLRLAARILVQPSTPHPHAIGVFDAHPLERRLMHLTQNLAPLGRTRRIALGAATLALATLTCGTALALRVHANPAAFQADSAPTQAVRISGGVAAGQVESRVAPIYPPDAKAARIQGAVVLHAIIGKEGKVESLSVVSGPPQLTQSAIDAVSKWAYKPYLLKGEPTAVDTIITVNYSFGK